MAGLSNYEKCEFIAEHGISIINSWEEGFIGNIERIIGRGYKLTNKQQAVLDKIYTKVKEAYSHDEHDETPDPDDDIPF